jgi:RNA polymerase sigma-70 factor (ECF subfamily)
MTPTRKQRAEDSSTNPVPSDTKETIDWQAALAEHQRWLRTVVYSRLHDRDATDDVMQELAVAAVRQSAPLRDRTKIAPWLYRLAVRQVLLYRRKMGRQRKLLDRYAEFGRDEPPLQAASDPLDWLLADERRRLIRRAIERLPDRDAEILLLKYTEDWSYQQIAAHVGVSRSAIEARLHRARGRMRRELAAMEAIETP